MIQGLPIYLPKRTFVLGISEACLIHFTLVTVTVLGSNGGLSTFVLHYGHELGKIAVVSVPLIACMYFFDLYNSLIMTNLREATIRLAQVLGAMCIFWAFVDYICPTLELDQRIVLTGLTFVALLLLLSRKMFLVINGVPQLADRILILGDGPLAEPLLKEFNSRPELGLRVVSRVLTVGNGNNLIKTTYAEPTNSRLGPCVADPLSDAVKRFRVNRIVVAMKDRRGKLPVQLLLSLKCSGVRVEDGTDVYETVTGKVPIESIQEGWLLFSPGFCVSRFIRAYKRLASITLSTIGMLISLPILPFIIVAIKVTSPGPVLYRQRRVGRDGVVFYCHKFRTMRADAEADTGPTWATDDDPRITPVGRFMRKTRMDEIPQLWNVLTGDMSLIGPRPERPEFVGWLGREIPYYHLRHAVRPGVTGWAQVRYEYGRSVEDAKEKLRYDLFYIKNMSPGLDFLIFFHTIKTILLGRGAK